MEIKFFKKDEHCDIINAWRDKLNRKPQPSYNLPPTGVIVFDEDNIGLAAGWLIRTDGGYCIFENFIANIEANRKDRSKAVDLVIKALEEIAIREGYKVVVGYPEVQILLKRTIKHGYNIIHDALPMIRKGVA